MSIGKRLRFEIFKRDKFTCRYCGGISPKVILEVDHIVPKATGGTDDELNLVTSCFSCNSGKSDKNLSEIITGEDPHDKAVIIAERERQLHEYYAVKNQVEIRINQEMEWIRKRVGVSQQVVNKIRSSFREHDAYEIAETLELAIDMVGPYAVKFIPYFYGILRNRRKQNATYAADQA